MVLAAAGQSGAADCCGAALMAPEDLERRFAFHPATTPERQLAHQSVRTHCHQLAGVINDLLPEGREKSLAVTKLEEVMFWANAGLARQSDA